MSGALTGHINKASIVRSTASVTDSVPRTMRIGGPHGPWRSKTHKVQSRTAKITTLAVTIKRRGTASRADCEESAVLGRGRDELIYPISYSNKSMVLILSINIARSLGYFYVRLVLNSW